MQYILHHFSKKTFQRKLSPNSVIINQNEEKMNEQDFWNDNELAQKVLQENKSLKETVEEYYSLKEGLEEIEVLIERKWSV